MADDPRQDRAGAHVRARQADAGEQEGGLGVGRGEPQVAGHRHDRPGAGADAFDRGDDRLRAAAHRPHQVAGHPGEVEQARRASILVSGPMISWTSPPEQKLPPAPVSTTAFTSRRVVQRAEGVAKLGIAFEGQRVLALGPVERDRRDPVREVPQEMLRARTPRRRSSRAGAAVDGHRGAVDVAALRQAQRQDHVADRRPGRPAGRWHSCW